jgi:hypothetical protein
VRLNESMGSNTSPLDDMIYNRKTKTKTKTK